MVNNDRVVPITTIDRITDFGEKLAVAGAQFAVVAAKNVAGDFEVGTSYPVLLNQPARSIDFTDVLDTGLVYFIPDYDFKGCTIGGNAPASVHNEDIVNADRASVYKIALSDEGTVITYTAVTPTPTTEN